MADIVNAIRLSHTTQRVTFYRTSTGCRLDICTAVKLRCNVVCVCSAAARTMFLYRSSLLMFHRHVLFVLYRLQSRKKTTVSKARATSYLLVRAGAPPVKALLGVHLSWRNIYGTFDRQRG